MHKSIPIQEYPIEILDIQSISPLISKCNIKVCYVQDEPNRNNTIINKETAKSIAESLRGSPIVGHYNSQTEDFEEHNRIIEIVDDQLRLKDDTQPYGFVDLTAKIWFQKFLDDDEIEREYLVTEGYLWTKQYPECQKVIDDGNNQSMELDSDFVQGEWTKDENGKPQFFIINEAIISKLCILGENNEPCFEGSQITSPLEFSYNEDFKNKLFAMLKDLEKIVDKEGGSTMKLNTYAVEIGDPLWRALWKYLEDNFPYSYQIEGIFEDDGQKYMIVLNCKNSKYYRLDFSFDENDEIAVSNTLVEVTKTYTPKEEPQFDPEEVANYAKQQREGKEEETVEAPEDEEKCPKCNKPLSECTCEDEDEDEESDKGHYSLEEIPEYKELSEKYSNLQKDYEDLQSSYSLIEKEKEELVKFKKSVEKKEKESMIDSFYMLSDEDKSDVIENIDTYSLNDIEAKLSILCVRNKVSFSEETAPTPSTTFNLDSGDAEDLTPAWVKRALSVAKTL